MFTVEKWVMFLSGVQVSPAPEVMTVGVGASRLGRRLTKASWSAFKVILVEWRQQSADLWKCWKWRGNKIKAHPGSVRETFGYNKSSVLLTPYPLSFLEKKNNTFFLCCAVHLFFGGRTVIYHNKYHTGFVLLKSRDRTDFFFCSVHSFRYNDAGSRSPKLDKLQVYELEKNTQRLEKDLGWCETDP